MGEENPVDAEGSAIRRERFSTGPARDFLSSLADDERIFEADLAVDRAHVVMLEEREIIDETSASAILKALEAIETAGFEALPDGEDVHEAIESAVIDRVGPDGGWMHTARSRNDEVATCIRYRLREDVLDVLGAVLELREAIAAVVAEHTETVMPGYTHLQPAQPTTIAHWHLSYERALARDTGRLFDAYERIDRSPLGAAAFAGTPFDIDRERTAELLGFESVLVNSMDAVSARDFLVETVGALATLVATLSGLAEDVVLFANQGDVDLADAYASTSSIMPQKKNPDTLELVRASAGDANSALVGLLTTLKGLPRAYNRDLQRATPHVWTAIDDAAEATDVTAGALATAEWNGMALAERAGEGFTTATGVADRLAMAGLPFRVAHEIVASAAHRSRDEDAADRHDGGAGPDYAAIEAAAGAVLDDSLETYVERSTIEAALDPAASVASRDSAGGPAPEAVDAQLATAEAALADDARTLSERRALLARATETRMEVVNAYA